MNCFKRLAKWLVPLALLGLIPAFFLAKSSIQSGLKTRAAGWLVPGVNLSKVDGQDIVLTGPPSLRESAVAAVDGQWGVDKVTYIPTAEPAPAPTTTIAPATTVAPATTTTAAPATTKAPVTTTAAPATTTTVAPTTTAAPVTTVAAAVCSSTLDGVKFATSAADLLPESLPILDAAAANLAKATCKVEIQGHTDIRGTIASNNALSQARADSVRNYLISKGIAADRLTAVGFGSSQPKVPGDNEAAWSQNRRIEIKVQGS
jgi:outer membrane protein OmpA-like peptidoglycan-associated protein